MYFFPPFHSDLSLEMPSDLTLDVDTDAMSILESPGYCKRPRRGMFGPIGRSDALGLM